METYPVDIDPGQVVRWVMTEHRAAPSTFRIIARRITELLDIPFQTELGLGDEEREDLGEIATIASVEIAPVHASDGWRLTVTVEDELGPRMPDNGSTVESEEEIDLDTFYKEYIRTGRGSANVVAEADDPDARDRMTLLLNAIERDQHSSHVKVIGDQPANTDYGHARKLRRPRRARFLTLIGPDQPTLPRTCLRASRSTSWQVGRPRSGSDGIESANSRK